MKCGCKSWAPLYIGGSPMTDDSECCVNELREALEEVLSECITYNGGGSGEFTSAPTVSTLEKARAVLARGGE